MNQIEALKIWMKENGYTNATLAEKLGYTYETVYSVTSRPDRPINDKFRWRFATKIGWDVASKLFGERKAHQGESEPIHA